MNDKALELLNRLAEKFGTTVEHLWGVLIKQAPISAVSEMVMTLIFAIVWMWTIRFVHIKTTASEEPWDEMETTLAWGMVVSFGLILMINIYCTVTSSLTAFLNPEYWALKQLLP